MDTKIKETARRALDSDDDALSDDELLAELENDPELERFREARLEQLKHEIDTARELRARGHGTYTIITKEQDMVKLMGTEKMAIVHFTHTQFARCKIMDKHLQTKFAGIDATKCPFLVNKFQVRTLPCLLAIRNGSCVDRLVGFEEFGNSDKFSTESLEIRLAKSGVVQLPKGSLASVPVAQRPVAYSAGGDDSGSGGESHDELDY
ncbi:thioredoxin-like protein [Linderina pennispora]|uniref:Thioredoxin-like protein n=1 Tax=Linderina pennispora TaxID=61395 RepID=A0A1Y1WMW7_9FUNG|nr:thioredoxin-like protein [Linderina pennispora]ORX74454.1 thioredoxin-like protein [Linderina pennispora]